MEKRPKRKVGKILAFLVFAGLVGMFSVNLYQQEQRFADLMEEKEELTQERDELSIEKNRLDRLYEYTKTDEYIEQYVRERLGWVRSGEKVFQLPDDNDSQEP